MTGLMVEQLLNGLNYGLSLFLIAAGLALVFGIMHVINLAHGSLFMLGAYLAVAFNSLTGSFIASVVLSAMAVAIIGACVEQLLIKRLYKRSHLDQVLCTFGLILLANETVRWFSGGTPLFMPVPASLNGSITLPGGIDLSRYRLATTLVSAVVALLLWFVLARTRLGMRIRAAANDSGMVEHAGVNAKTLALAVFAGGAALAGVAGALNGPLTSIEVGMGERVLILAFVIVVIGGLGSIAGTFYGALLVGVVDSTGRAFLPMLLEHVLDARSTAAVAPAISSILIYLLMTLVLCLRPAGLFGR